jgi:coenzyme PQQ precursor peptide PqqA
LIATTTTQVRQARTSVKSSPFIDSSIGAGTNDAFLASCVQLWRNAMAWKTPQIVEFAVGMEINTYACADL